MEIVDLDTLKQICYDSTEEEILEIYEEINGYNFLNKDFKDIKIKELDDFFDFVRKVKKIFPNVLKEVYDIDIEEHNVEEELKKFLQILKNKGTKDQLKENEDVFELTSEDEKEEVPFVDITYGKLKKMQGNLELKKKFRINIMYISKRWPKKLKLNIPNDDTSIRLLVDEINKFKGKNK